MCFTVIVFASLEKVRKELFIINHTNSKTKKQIMKFFSQSPPCLIMEKDGTIKLCNESFEHFVNEILRIRNMPKDFYKFIQADEKASETLNFYRSAGLDLQNIDQYTRFPDGPSFAELCEECKINRYSVDSEKHNQNLRLIIIDCRILMLQTRCFRASNWEPSSGYSEEFRFAILGAKNEFR